MAFYFFNIIENSFVYYETMKNEKLFWVVKTQWSGFATIKYSDNKTNPAYPFAFSYSFLSLRHIVLCVLEL